MVEVPDISLSTRVATMASTLSIGLSYQPGLLPRSTSDQAMLTGLTSAFNFGLVAVTGSAVDGVATTIVGRDRMQQPGFAAIAQGTAHAVALAAGIGVRRLVPARRGQSVKRSTLRSAAWLTAMTGATGVVAAGVVATGELLAERKGEQYRRIVAPTTFVLASGFAAFLVAHNRRDARRDVLPPPVDPHPISPQADFVAKAEVKKYENAPSLAKSLLYGLGVSAGLHVAAFGESMAAEGIAKGLGALSEDLRPFAGFVGQSITLGLVSGAAVGGLEYLHRTAESGGAAVEAAYDQQPTTMTVSGGPGSSVPFETLSREGRRVVNMVLSADEIEAVTGKPAMDPIRAFVGLATAEQVDERVDMLMRELEDLGAFEREVLCFCSPTGTGYVNYVMMETLEYLTAGNCAIFALQYSLRPSFISLDRVAMGRHQNRAMLLALSWRLRAIPQDKRPRLVIFGESLGAHTMQDCFLHEGTHGFERAGIDRGLFLGTPAGSEWAQRWRDFPERNDPDGIVVEIADMAELAALPEDCRKKARFFLLSHHEDPITKFNQQLAVEEPRWLQEPREPGVPRGLHWRPVGTMLNVGIDLKNSTDVVPGVFVARGHDYRAGLAEFTSLAFNLPTDEQTMADIETALRERELKWAARRVQAEQMQRTSEAIQRQLSQWGIADISGLSGPSTAPLS